jgi:hypothetical protein
MTVTELLETVRRVELRTNRLVNVKAMQFSRQASAQFRWIPRAVENRKDGKGIVFDRKMDGVFPEAAQANFLRASTHPLKKFWIGQRTAERTFYFQLEFFAKSGPFRFISSHCLLKFRKCCGLENDWQAHCHPKRLLSLASTRSQGIPSRGFFSNSARRRSSSAACSGVSSSSKAPYFSQTFSATCCRSPGGKWPICSRISVAFMVLIYSVGSFVQARFFRRMDSALTFQHAALTLAIP